MYVPIAMVRSNLEDHGSVPGSSLAAGLLLLELGLEVGFPVVKVMIRAEGRL